MKTSLQFELKVEGSDVSIRSPDIKPFFAFIKNSTIEQVLPLINIMTGAVCLQQNMVVRNFEFDDNDDPPVTHDGWHIYYATADIEAAPVVAKRPAPPKLADYVPPPKPPRQGLSWLGGIFAAIIVGAALVTCARQNNDENERHPAPRKPMELTMRQ